MRENIDELSREWAPHLQVFYPELTEEEVFRKVRRGLLIILRSIREQEFHYIIRMIQRDIPEWIMRGHPFTAILDMKTKFFRTLEDFLDRQKDLSLTEKEGILHIFKSLQNPRMLDKFYAAYIQEQEQLLNRRLEELEVINRVSQYAAESMVPKDVIRSILSESMNILEATDGAIGLQLKDGTKLVEVKFEQSYERIDKDIVAQITGEETDKFDNKVLDALAEVSRTASDDSWSPEMLEDLMSNHCPNCRLKDSYHGEVRGLLSCPILSTLKVSTFMCHSLRFKDHIKGFFLLSKSNVPVFTEGDHMFVATLSETLLKVLENYLFYKELEQLATTDGLTGLYNHRFFQDALGKEIKRANRYDTEVSLLYMDIDHFKKFNDTYGHQLGDSVLQLVAEVIRESVRDSDTCCRYGGEEMTVILPMCGHEDARLVAEKIRKNIENTPIKSDDGEEIRITISIGVATCPTNSTQQSDLIQKADAALYVSKDGGRNQVTVSKLGADDAVEDHG